ncbi:restriction endonuclease [Streptomyces sp. SID335]|nr:MULTISPECIES: HNH endonuclease [unclassified Streptomyces]NDZ99821.1 restriction endonuclease [Streptomyces sp. SID10116]MYY81475.1 restriction endonuclease [Streptomyces sp. SID335]MYZ15815.1 restriction endonuclease [Streptomyces sp. SID337]NDZ85280.1 restriction endonuclease [Streptomyces sp. SID10115]NEB49162.1 restriction endonuclease [Streptomyces sp. SID339]
MSALSGLRQAQIGSRRAPHKPLLVLWLLGRFAASGSTAVMYDEAVEPVSRLINDFGPAVTSPSRARERAAMPFVHLERTLWDLRDSEGNELGPGASERGNWLRAHGAHGRLRSEAEGLIADPGTLAAAARSLLEQHFTPALEAAICDAVGLDLAGLDDAVHLPSEKKRRSRRTGFAEEVLHAYAYACAFCGYDGALGRNPAGLEAAHVKGHSQDGPDEVHNGLALCSLHHTLFDLGVLGLLPDLRIQVSQMYVARSPAGQTIDALHNRPLATPRPGRPAVDVQFVLWHGQQVFKRPGALAA